MATHSLRACNTEEAQDSILYEANHGQKKKAETGCRSPIGWQHKQRLCLRIKLRANHAGELPVLFLVAGFAVASLDLLISKIDRYEVIRGV